ncbi:hypothetical protein [Dongia sp.]
MTRTNGKILVSTAASIEAAANRFSRRKEILILTARVNFNP